MRFSTPAQIVATDVSFEAYLEQHAHHFREWIHGAVIEKSPVSEAHDALTRYLIHLLDSDLELNPIGQTRVAPFVMRLNDQRGREPDLQVILKDNQENLTPTYMNGPADICIELVSEESLEHDRGTKFGEYEAAGVKEYWYLDPLRQEVRFYRLDDAVRYQDQSLADGSYETPLLPKLRVSVATLWQKPLPGAVTIAQSVSKMLK